MYLLESICAMDTLNPIWNIIGIVIRVIWIGVPIALIILGSIDLGKAVIQSKEDEVKKAKQAFIRRLIYAVLVFAVVWIVQTVISFIGNLNIAQDGTNTTDWSDCWDKIVTLSK